MTTNLTKITIFSLFVIFFVSIEKANAQTENAQISKLIEQKKDFNRKNKTSVVYRIQLFNGNETEAYKIRRNFQMEFPDYETEIIYTAPEWKTQVGKFKTRLEADRVLKIISEKFSGAIVLEDKI